MSCVLLSDPRKKFYEVCNRKGISVFWEDMGKRKVLYIQGKKVAYLSPSIKNDELNIFTDFLREG